MAALVNQESQSGQRLVAAIAEGRVFGLLAVAEPDLLFLLQGELLRPEAGAFVAAITHRLVAAESAGAPPVISGFEFDGAGLVVVNFGEGVHDG